MKSFIVVFTTCASKKEAQNIIGALLKKRLIACANIIGGMKSKFWWKGRIDTAKEILVMMKARAKDFKAIEKMIMRLHSYDVPEIVAVPIAAAGKSYLKWMEKEIR